MHSFEAHYRHLQDGTPEMAELQDALKSADLLVAYCKIHDIDLSREEAEELVAAMNRPLDDKELGDLSAGESTLSQSVNLLGVKIQKW